MLKENDFIIFSCTIDHSHVWLYNEKKKSNINKIDLKFIYFNII